MNRLFTYSILAVILLSIGSASAQRIERTINEAWRFTRDGKADEIVKIPHSWNRVDCLDDTPGYFRGVGHYEKSLRINEDLASHSFYLHFEGVANRVFDVAINGVKVLDDYDITAETGAEYGVVKKFMVDVDGGKGLSVDFTPVKGEPTLCAVRIYRHY